MKRLASLLVILPLGTGLCQAQAGMNSYDMADITRGRPTSTRNLNQSSADKEAAIAGTPILGYLNQGWNVGTLQTLDAQPGPVAGLRYNLKLQWLEVQDATVPGGVRVYPAGSLKGFTLVPAAGQTPRVFLDYKYRSTGSGSGRGYLEELNHVGDLRLLVRHTFEERPEEINPALNTVVRPAQQMQASSLFYTAPSQPGLAQQLQLDRRSVLRMCHNHAPKLEAYAKEKNLDYTNLNHVLQMVEFCNLQ
ncbi:hypothetical protein [Hymenobacter sp. BT190]|uniref:hypothetical protein n=1 Tax=Hymenobacter sp. BT190 TaxID=2763505 RepID=UPI0016514204|nr:hypothetical protein [Hymenobacter sp. BT190]MBC6697430.1 hypothetical protein [Hymenobacter sp. BT190]